MLFLKVYDPFLRASMEQSLLWVFIYGQRKTSYTSKVCKAFFYVPYKRQISFVFFNNKEKNTHYHGVQPFIRGL